MPSLGRIGLYLLTSLLLASTTHAADVVLNWNISWVYANPDGFVRPVIGINGQWPLPTLNVNVGDHVLINAHNGLGNRSTSLHFHGLYMNGSTHMDGPGQVSQCHIPAGNNFTYEFNINQTGTYWYHAHVDGQYPDGLRGPLIISDPDDPYKEQYDEEMVLTLSDWYHGFMPDLIAAFINVANPTGAEPVPDAALMNDTQNLKIDVQPGKTYKFRIINMGAFASQYFWIDGHSMQIIEVDGIYTEAAPADMLYITAAQRYSVLVTMKNDTGGNFAITGSMDTDLFDTVPPTLNPNVTSWLAYDSSKPFPPAADVDEFAPFDDYTLVPQDMEPLFDHVDYSIELNFEMDDLGNGANYAFFNGITYVSPKVPTLYTALSTGNAANSTQVYGSNTNAFVLQKGQIVEIVVNSNDPGKHPFHLHGHNFQAVYRGVDNEGPYNYSVALPPTPMRRDTFMVRPQGNIVLRFRADNPGVWLFHCHIEWHIDVGLVATMIEMPMELQAQFPDGVNSLPPNHLDACRGMDAPFHGNAAGNTLDLDDLSGENLPDAPPLPAGFTPKGIVALVFSALSAVLGMLAIVWYGIGEIDNKDHAAKMRAAKEREAVRERETSQ